MGPLGNMSVIFIFPVATDLSLALTFDFSLYRLLSEAPDEQVQMRTMNIHMAVLSNKLIITCVQTS
jgi:hypothetical protein